MQRDNQKKIIVFRLSVAAVIFMVASCLPNEVVEKAAKGSIKRDGGKTCLLQRVKHDTTVTFYNGFKFIINKL